jgi:UDP-glucose 4-epimerase
VLRYFNTFGPGQTYTPYVGVITIFIRKLLNGEIPTIFGDGEQRRDFVHVNDIVAANLLAMNSTQAYEIFNVGTGKATSVNEIADLLCARIAPNLRPVHADPHPGELRYSIADITHISEVLGYQPTASIESHIDEIIDYYRNGGDARP